MTRVAGCAEAAKQGTALAMFDAAVEPLRLKLAGAVGRTEVFM